MKMKTCKTCGASVPPEWEDTICPRCAEPVEVDFDKSVKATIAEHASAEKKSKKDTKKKSS